MDYISYKFDNLSKNDNVFIKENTTTKYLFSKSNFNKIGIKMYELTTIRGYIKLNELTSTSRVVFYVNWYYLVLILFLTNYKTDTFIIPLILFLLILLIYDIAKTKAFIYSCVKRE
jgi:hypothetical protein